MKKSEFLKAVKENLDLKNIEQAEQTVISIVEIINDALRNKDDKLKIDGLGTFKVVEKKATPEREGRNPATGESITIPAKKAELVLKFKEEK